MVWEAVHFRHRPWRGLGILGIPFFLMVGGSGVAFVAEGNFAVGIPLVVGGLLTLLPWLHAREVYIDDNAVTVREGLAGLARITRHERGAIQGVRWSEKHPRNGVEGSSRAKIFHLDLVGPDVTVPIPFDLPRVDEALALGRNLSLPIERLVDGQVVERWAADGSRRS